MTTPTVTTPLQRWRELVAAGETDVEAKRQASLFYMMNAAAIEQAERAEQHQVPTPNLGVYEPGKHAQLSAEGKQDPVKGRAAALFRMRFPSRVQHEQRLAEQMEAETEARIQAAMKPYLPQSPELDEFERLQREQPMSAPLYYRNAGNSRKIEAQREARDTRVQELRAPLDSALTEPEAGGVEQFTADVNQRAFGAPTAEPRAGDPPFTLGEGDPPTGPTKTITHRGQQLTIVELPQTPRPDGSPPDIPPQAA